MLLKSSRLFQSLEILVFDLCTLSFDLRIFAPSFSNHWRANKAQSFKYKDLISKFEKFHSSGKVLLLCKITI